MRLLYISSLFPNPSEPVKGRFNAQQVQALSKLCNVTVIAPTAQALVAEEACGARVLHPRWWHVPVVTRPWNGWLYARAIEPWVRAESFDLAFASFAYPDGYATMLLGERLGFPFAIDVLGSDINLQFGSPYRRNQILRALRASCAVFAKSQALANRLATYGIQAHIDYNGIDRALFQQRDRSTICRQLQLEKNRRRILYVGNLQPVKGPTVLAEAFALLQEQEEFRDVDLIFIGSGPEQAKVARISGQRSAVSYQVPDASGLQSQVTGLQSQVFLLGSRPHSEIPDWMSACDLLCLPSQQEGLPNVILEAMACGCPVVASNVGGVPEIVQQDRTGFLVPAGNASALAAGLRDALVRAWDTNRIRQATERFDWERNACELVAHLEQALAAQRN